MTPDDIRRSLQDAFWTAGDWLLFHHTNPWELDEALVDFGFGVGPCEAQDLIGLDRVLGRKPVHEVPVLRRMVAEGRLGKIGGVGYYRYPGGGGAVIDPLIEDLIREEAWFAKVERRDVEDAALVTGMCAALGGALTELKSQGLSDDALHKALVDAVHYPVNASLPVQG